MKRLWGGGIRHALFATTAMASTALIASGAAAQTVPAEPVAAAASPLSDQTAAPSVGEPDNGQATPAKSEDIVVTGSRITRNGYSAPTPVTVVGADRAEKLGIVNTTDLLNQLPATRPSASAATQRTGQVPGVSNADLRGLGPTRTLVLVDGRRFVPNGTNGAVDLNLVPTSLIQRVEVVTGGASAAYGADAVAGVVNFILDSKFTGVRMSVSSGITELGDGANYSVSLALGTKFAGDRGHVIFGAEWVDNEGMGSCYTRSYCKKNAGPGIVNPLYGTNGLPGIVRTANPINARSSLGGLIVTSPAGTGANAAAANALRGIAFRPDGTPYNYTFGDLVYGPNGTISSNPWMVGGETSEPDSQIYYKSLPAIVPVEHYSAFARAEFQVTPAIKLFAEGSYGHLKSTDALKYSDLATITIRSDNAYLPQSVRSLMTAGGITSFAMGRTNDDLLGSYVNKNDTYRGVLGLTADLGSRLKLDGYYQYGRSDQVLLQYNNRLKTQFANAVDAVVNPATNQIVCRSTIANPTNGCVPINLFGQNQFTQGAFDYVTGDGYQKNRFVQHVGSLAISGTPLTLWAGDVGLAVGVEYRRNASTISVDPQSQASAFVQLNPKASAGNIDIIEGFAEIDVPLLKNWVIAKSLDFNGAIRKTRTTASSAVGGRGRFDAVTWKLGLTYEPVDGVRFRATYSQDIRAPNAVELFSSPLTTTSTFTDRVTNQYISSIPLITSGNINAQPEKSHTFSAGVVLRPKLLPGLGLSIDYYNIRVDDALGQLAPQTIADRCYFGVQSLCALIIRDSANNPIRINGQYTNFGSFKLRGIDFDLSYRSQLGGGDNSIDLRLLANYVKDFLITDAGGTTQWAGALGFQSGWLAAPRWRADATASLNLGAFSFTAQEQFIAAGVDNPTLAVPGDPNYSLTGNPLTANNEFVPSRFYTNIVTEVRVGSTGHQFTIFWGIDNLFNVDPPAISTSRNTTNPMYYDILGRRYKAGVRVRF